MRIKATNQHWEQVYNNQSNNSNLTEVSGKPNNAVEYVQTNHPVKIVGDFSVKLMLESYIQKSDKAGDGVMNPRSQFRKNNNPPLIKKKREWQQVIQNIVKLMKEKEKEANICKDNDNKSNKDYPYFKSIR